MQKTPAGFSQNSTLKYVHANNAVIHSENSKLLLDLNCSPKEVVTGILAKISLGTGIWAKFRLGTGICTPLYDLLHYLQLQLVTYLQALLEGATIL